MNAIGFDPSKISSLQIPQYGGSPYGVAPRQASPVVPQSVLGFGNSRFNDFNSEASFAGLPQSLTPNYSASNGAFHAGGCSCGGGFNTFA